MSPRTLQQWLDVFVDLARRDRPDPEALGKRLAQMVEEEEENDVPQRMQVCDRN